MDFLPARCLRSQVHRRNFYLNEPDVMDVFFNHLKEQEVFVSEVLSKVVKMNQLSEEEQKIHTNAMHYKLFGNCFEHDKVRHHDHITGSSIEQYCNRYQPATKIGKDEMSRNKSQLLIMEVKRNSVTILM